MKMIGNGVGAFMRLSWGMRGFPCKKGRELIQL